MSATLELPASDLSGGERGAAARWWHGLSCRVFGHEVDNREFARQRHRSRRCRCGAPYLAQDGSRTRIRHTVSCFVRHHTYARSGTRHGHTEYMCTRCGHPLLFETGRDPYRQDAAFAKKVRYLCNLFGHRVHTVCERSGFTEYACGCGHTFLLRRRGMALVRHPPDCLFAGHFIRYVEMRDGYEEHRCRTCGHTFGFVQR